ncbi:MAG: SH3 domain-containing protein [bacterium]
METFWIRGILFSGIIFGVIYLCAKNLKSTAEIYGWLSGIFFVVSCIAFLTGSLFYKKFVYNTWYWEPILPLRESLLIAIERQEALSRPPIIAVIKVKTANVRKSASTEAEVITTLNRGEKLRVLVSRKDWTLVQFDDKIEGWIHNSLLDFADSLKATH